MGIGAALPLYLSLRLDLPADASLLPETRRTISGFLSRLGAREDVVHDVILALDEACANVIRHAYPEGSTDSPCIRVAAELSDSDVTVCVEDDGVGVDPLELALHAPEEPEAVSGRGLRIIRGLMTSVDVESPGPGHGTRVRMHRVFAPSELDLR